MASSPQEDDDRIPTESPGEIVDEGGDEMLVAENVAREVEESVLGVIFSYNSLAHAFSGATGSVVAMSAFFPLDTVRTRLQVDEKRRSKGSLKTLMELCQEEGIGTLYRGLGPVLKSLYCSNFVYFYTYNGLKSLCRSKGIKLHMGRNLLIGYVSGIVNAFVTTPMWVVNTRMKLQGVQWKSTDNKPKPEKFNGIIDGMMKIAKAEGILALWSGIRASFVLAGNPAIHFMVYELIKKVMEKTILVGRGKNPRIRSFEYFAMGGTAKAVATLFTYPLQLVQCQLRANRVKGVAMDKGVIEVLLAILKKDGFLGLFKGLEAKLIQTILTAALMFTCYEKIVSFILKLLRVNGKLKV